jgi:uncharacterized cupin superfamily protein
MEHVTISAVESVVDTADIKRPLTEALGTTSLALNYYELAPGESLAYGYHAHETQEEVFVVQSGTVTFETEHGEVAVDSGEVIRFAPGEYQQGRNLGSDRAAVLALGAPRETGDSEPLRDCETCGERTPQTIEWAEEQTVRQTRCQVCGEVTARFE